MAFRDFNVADSDMHVLEPADLWQRYIDPAWKHAAPVGLTEMRRDMRVKVKSHVMLRIGPVRPMAAGAGAAWSSEQDAVFADAEKRGWDGPSQLAAMDKEGLDIAVLFPSRGLFVLGLDSRQVAGVDGLEGDFAAAIARAYNDWLFDFCQTEPKRMLGAGMVAPHDVDLAVAETRRCVEKLGFKAIFLAPGCVNRRPWHDPVYDPLWAECERLNIALTFHGGGQTFLKPDFSLEVFDKLSHWHVFNQPLGVMTALTSICAGGVLARFPELRVGLLEGNCGWAPWLLQRIDEHWEWVGRYETPELKRKPSEYFRERCFLSVEAEEETVADYVRWFGDENLVFSTDYPHADSKYPRSVEHFLHLPLEESAQRKILWRNWARLYDIALP
jgi:uncharacterized protein